MQGSEGILLFIHWRIWLNVGILLHKCVCVYVSVYAFCTIALGQEAAVAGGPLVTDSNERL